MTGIEDDFNSVESPTPEDAIKEKDPDAHVVTPGKDWIDPNAKNRTEPVDPYLVVKYSPIPPKIFRFPKLQSVLAFLETDPSRVALAKKCWEVDGGEHSSMQISTWTTYVKVWMGKCGQKKTKKVVPEAWNRVKKFNENLPSLEIPETYNTIIGIQFQRVLEEYDLLNSPEANSFGFKEKVARQNQLDRRIYLLDKLLRNANSVYVEIEKIKGQFYRFTRALEEKNSGEDKSDIVNDILSKYQNNMSVKTREVLASPESRRRLLNVLEHVRAGTTGQMAEVLRKQEDKLKQLMQDNPGADRSSLVIEVAKATAVEMEAD